MRRDEAKPAEDWRQSPAAASEGLATLAFPARKPFYGPDNACSARTNKNKQRDTHLVKQRGQSLLPMPTISMFYGIIVE